MCHVSNMYLLPTKRDNLFSPNFNRTSQFPYSSLSQTIPMAIFSMQVGITQVFNKPDQINCKKRAPPVISNILYSGIIISAHGINLSITASIFISIPVNSRMKIPYLRCGKVICCTYYMYVCAVCTLMFNIAS